MYSLRLPRPLLAAFDPVDAGDTPSTTALGDWHARAAVVGTRHLAVCVSAASELTVVFPLPPLPDLPQHLAGALAPVLRDLGASVTAIAAELEEMVDGQMAATRDRGMRALLAARVGRLERLIATTPPGAVDARQLHAALAALPVRHADETCGARARHLLENRRHA